MKKILVVSVLALSIVFILSGCSLSDLGSGTNSENSVSDQGGSNVESNTKSIVILYSGGKAVHYWITDSNINTFNTSDLVSIEDPKIEIHGETVTVRNVRPEDIRKVMDEYGLVAGSTYDGKSNYSHNNY